MHYSFNFSLVLTAPPWGERADGMFPLRFGFLEEVAS